MCEFTVVFDGEIVFKDVVYVKMKRDKAIVRDILGESREFRNCRIVEVNVNSARLVLSSVQILEDL